MKLLTAVVEGLRSNTSIAITLISVTLHGRASHSWDIEWGYLQAQDGHKTEIRNVLHGIKAKVAVLLYLYIYSCLIDLPHQRESEACIMSGAQSPWRLEYWNYICVSLRLFYGGLPNKNWPRF